MGRDGKSFKKGYIPLKSSTEYRTSKLDLARNIKVFDKLWKRGLLPKDFKQHYFLTWLAYSNGNASKLSKALGLHRNTIIWVFKNLKINKTYKFRILWRNHQMKSLKQSFHKQFNSFFKKMGGKPSFKPLENKNLVALWLMKMPPKAVKAHFVLWALRSGFTRKQVSQKLDISERSMHRIRFNGAQKSSKMGQWLAPLKPTVKDWYPNRKVT
jgi:hypothetical protein